MQMSDLALHAAALGLRVERDPDMGELNGELRSDGTIRVNAARRRSVQREIVAHEIGHHVHGHDRTSRRHDHAREERQADTYAARLLISPAEYRLAELLVGPNPHALASELEVSALLVRLWQDSFRRDRVELARRLRLSA